MHNMQPAQVGGRATAGCILGLHIMAGNCGRSFDQRQRSCAMRYPKQGEKIGYIELSQFRRSLKVLLRYRFRLIIPRSAIPYTIFPIAHHNIAFALTIRIPTSLIILIPQFLKCAWKLRLKGSTYHPSSQQVHVPRRLEGHQCHPCCLLPKIGKASR